MPRSLWTIRRVHEGAHGLELWYFDPATGQHTNLGDTHSLVPDLDVVKWILQQKSFHPGDEIVLSNGIRVDFYPHLESNSKYLA